jgi:S1-C subfamily serine protease
MNVEETNMNAFRKGMLAVCLAVSAWPSLGAAPQPAPDPQQGDVQSRLEDARKRLEAATRDVAELSRQLGRNFMYQVESGISPPPRALLGVELDGASDSKDGAHVRNVSPGGAAAEAGIKPGDVITSIGGKDLTKEPDPDRALVDMMRQVEPDLKLHVDVLRDGRKQGFDVTPRTPPPQVNLQSGDFLRSMPELGRLFTQQGGPGTPGERRTEIRTLREGPDDGTRFRGLEFATLSEKLGSYFGVKSGVLVVRAGANAAFKLQDGDVILAIDGREPTSAQHAARILRSYSDGEKFTLRIQRDRKAQNIDVTMPRGGPEDMDR